MTARKTPTPTDEPARRIERVTTTREQLADTEARDAPIEVWLGDLAGDASIAYVRVWKRAGARWSWLGKRNDIVPPFDFDPDALFQLYGDGEYRFVPYDTAGKMRGGRNELVQAGYAAKFRNAPDGTTSPGSEGESDTADLSEMIRLERQRMILRNLREASGGGAELGAMPYVERDRADELDRLQQITTIIAALQPKPLDLAALIAALGTILGPIIGKLLTPPDPADKVFGLFEKWLDLRERIDPPEGGDWKSALVRGLSSLLENPQIRQAVIGGGMPSAIPAVVPAPSPIPPPTTPPGASPPSPANGSPGPVGPPLTPHEQRARHVLATLIWPLVKQAALAGSEDRETYAALIDQHLDGFLEQWAQSEPNIAITILGRLDPEVLTNVELQRWLLGFHGWVREDFLQRDDSDEGPAPGGGMPAL
jgi:hypothetical protein